MYTRCPSCRSEISFAPPQNLSTLPEGYKHRIRCPHCSVTIGVKIPRQEMYLQPNMDGNYNHSPDFQPIMRDDISHFSDYPAPKKKSGRIRNFTIGFFALLIVAINIVVHFAGDILASNEILSGLLSFNGIGAIISLIDNPEVISALFEADLALSFVGIALPLIFFLLACIYFVSTFIAFIAGKYSRPMNVIMSLLMLGAGIGILIGFPMIFDIGIFESGYIQVIGAAIGGFMLFFSLVFLKPMIRKR